jgi:hypothetical protein
MKNEALDLIDQPTKIEPGKWYSLQADFCASKQTEITPRMIAAALGQAIDQGGLVDSMSIREF